MMADNGVNACQRQPGKTYEIMLYISRSNLTHTKEQNIQIAEIDIDAITQSFYFGCSNGSINIGFLYPGQVQWVARSL